MNSPQPLSASQRGAKCLTPPSFASKRRGQGGWVHEADRFIFELLLFIPDSHKNKIRNKWKDVIAISLIGKGVLSLKTSKKPESIFWLKK